MTLFKNSQFIIHNSQCFELKVENWNFINWQLWIMNFELWIEQSYSYSYFSNGSLWINEANRQFWIMNSELWILNYELWIMNSKEFTTFVPEV